MVIKNGNYSMESNDAQFYDCENDEREGGCFFSMAE